MPRIHYRERKLHTLPLKNEVIAPSLFNEIMKKSDFIAEGALQIFELPPVASSSIFFWKKDKNFRYAIVWNSEKSYTTYEYGGFFLSKAIVFFDVEDAYFPSDCYFIVSIDDQLELGHAKAGADAAWYEQPQLWHQVSNPKLIKRSEHSVKALHDLLSGNQ